MDTRATIDAAIEHHRAGRLPDAEALYREVLTFDPRDFDALHLLGVIALQCGNYLDAVELIGRAVLVNSASADAYANHADACRGLGRMEDAKTSYEAALALSPGRADTLNSLGIVLATQGRIAEAAEAFDRALQCNPSYLDAALNLGNAHLDLAQFSDAINAYERALEIDTNSALALVSLGRALQQSGRQGEALAKYQEGLAVDPNLAYGHLLLGHLLHERGLVDDALESFGHAKRLEPENVDARWAFTMSQLALVHESATRAQTSRGSFESALNDLDSWLGTDRALAGANVVGNQQPFYLAYYEENNRELLSRYGDISSRLTLAWQASQGIALPAPGRHKRIRIGIVSGQIRNHSVWNAIVKGWVQHTDASRFAFHIFHTGRKTDDETAFARARAERFIQAPKSIREWVEYIVAEPLDILIYPEIGMDGATLKLASMRLAPIQAASWGHPETTGLPTIDYYLSAADFEPPGAQQNYREKLVALPHLGCCYEPLPVGESEIDLESFGIDPDQPILICPGVAFKYAPRHDWIFVQLAKKLKRCQFVFFHDVKQNLSEALERRLELAFEREEMFFQSHGLFLPWLDRAEFFALMRRATVYLDTIGFSGFNTAMQAIQCGLPVVAREGRFMRSRLASGILRRMGMTELIAASEQGYIDLAAKVAMDETYNKQIRNRILETRDVLFGDIEPIRGFEDFIADVAGQRHAPI